jgi:protein-L-isoaspartate(D-aspartate) O-methyltransferase
MDRRAFVLSIAAMALACRRKKESEAMQTHAPHAGPGAMDARNGLLVQQLIDRGALRDPRVIDAFKRTPRHLFVPDAHSMEAYADRPLPIGYGATISQPTVVAMMTEALELTPQSRVLEIGTGSGYQAAILGRLCAEVYSIEIVTELANSARAVIERLGLKNVHVRAGDGYAGWPEHAPFDRVIMTAAPPKIPQKLLEQLRDPGILIGPVGSIYDVQSLVRVRKSAGQVTEETITDVRFVPMIPGPATQ